jgi:hypothetical protein
MVFQRLKMKASEGWRESDRWGKSLSGDSFTAADVPLSAKETCRNWFYKSSCIRELLPRVYIELSLFKCYRFVTDDDFGSILSRITSVIRGNSCHLHVPTLLLLIDGLVVMTIHHCCQYVQYVHSQYVHSLVTCALT